MKIKPLFDYVLVKAFEKETSTKSGIILLATNNDKTTIKGEILEIGSGRINENGTTIPLQVKKGNKIIFSEYLTTNLTFDEKKYFIIRESDILAIIDTT